MPVQSVCDWNRNSRKGFFTLRNQLSINLQSFNKNIAGHESTIKHYENDFHHDIMMILDDKKTMINVLPSESLLEDAEPTGWFWEHLWPRFQFLKILDFVFISCWIMLIITNIIITTHLTTIMFLIIFCHKS